MLLIALIPTAWVLMLIAVLGVCRAAAAADRPTRNEPAPAGRADTVTDPGDRRDPLAMGGRFSYDRRLRA